MLKISDLKVYRRSCSDHVSASDSRNICPNKIMLFSAKIEPNHMTIVSLKTIWKDSTPNFMEKDKWPHQPS